MEKSATILLATSQSEIKDILVNTLSGEFEISHQATYEECIKVSQEIGHNFLFLDVNYIPEKVINDKVELRNLLKALRKGSPMAPIIILAPIDKTRQAVTAVRSGADEYLNYPIDSLEIKHVMDSILEQNRLEEELDYLRDEFWQADLAHLVKTRSPKMGEVYKRLKSVAPTKTTVLLIGETGTGKGVLSQLLHSHSNRNENPYIGVHCGAIPDNLIESELFGHEKGSFTGAIKQKLGKFELAQGGTIFLDEIGTVTKPLQIKLLKVLQEKIYQRVGGEVDLETDARIVAATNENIKELTDNGEFRSDLYYRLNVFPIEIPPLRNRLEDIPLLVNGFLNSMNEREGREILEVDTDVIEAFQNYTWPGNIRELENLIERAYILETSNVLSPESFPMELFDWREREEPKVLVDTALPMAEARKRTVDSMERNYLKAVLEQTKGKISDASIIAGITTRQLHKVLTKYGIRKEDYKK